MLWVDHIDVYSPRVWILCVDHIDVYSPRVWLLWVDDIGGVLTSSVAIVG